MIFCIPFFDSAPSMSKTHSSAFDPPAGALFGASEESTATPEQWAQAWVACAARRETEFMAWAQTSGALVQTPPEWVPFMAIGARSEIDSQRLDALLAQARSADDAWLQNALAALPEFGHGTFLGRAVGNTGHLDFLGRLVNLGVNLNASISCNGETALTFSISFGYAKAVDLLAPMSDTQRVDANGNTALNALCKTTTLLNEARVRALLPQRGKMALGISPLALALQNEFAADDILEMLAPFCDPFNDQGGARALDAALKSWNLNWASRVFDSMRAIDASRAYAMARESATRFFDDAQKRPHPRPRDLPILDFCCSRDLLSVEQEDLFLNFVRDLDPKLTPIAHARAERRDLMKAISTPNRATCPDKNEKNTETPVQSRRRI